jgi:hypothetical protein
MGIVMSQEFGTPEKSDEHPCLYLSRKLTPREQTYGTTEKECACLVWAVVKLRPYLYGKPFVIESDHNPLHWLGQVADKNARLLRWSLIMQDLEYIVRYKKGSLHTNADAMSRYFSEAVP